ncbi:hypothetical protein CMT41_08765 [Colwellia sp. MT41]|uniref:acyl-CoA dehydrogenase family protein n=1 Tax=Colwellia sp. MT41 TaxID=58049 RepID=UPI000717A021|nr:acyl-CoA dehydrogenase family protein [Colwellia sp. MT41]ALO34798.1 hypothetical protein CMT41_08765 [Colwellia sp. MT41]
MSQQHVCEIDLFFTQKRLKGFFLTSYCYFPHKIADGGCYIALQLYGGTRYIKEYALAQLARDVRITTIYESMSEIQRVILVRNI